MEFLPGLHIVPGARWSRIYLIEDSELTLVDTGLPWNARPVFDYIRSIGRRPEELANILMTHCHPDHTSGAAVISRLTGAEVIAHCEDTRPRNGGGVSLCYMRVFSSLAVPLPFLRRVPVARLVSDGDTLPVQGGLRIVHTPGHTPGSVCFLLEDRGVLFSGDTLFSNGHHVSRSVPFPGSDVQQYRQSLEKIASLSFSTLCGGHGKPLLSGASDQLKELLAKKPDPPTWGDFLKSVPRRLYQRRVLHGTDFY